VLALARGAPTGSSTGLSNVMNAVKHWSYTLGKFGDSIDSRARETDNY
jgi:hypothetical protein